MGDARIRWSSSRDALAERLSRWIMGRHGEGRAVLFLVSGGSTAPIALAVVDRCPAALAPRPGREGLLRAPLSLALVDERYGRDGHPDSNWRRLREAGLDPRTFPSFDALAGCDGRPEGLKPALERFASFLGEAARLRDGGDLAIAGLLGVGADGHTAGILPRSGPSALADAPSPLADAYRGPDFTRLTATPAFFSRMDLALAWAEGEGKRQALERVAAAGPGMEGVLPALFLFRAGESAIHTDLAKRSPA